jgi:hypothetical protein
MIDRKNRVTLASMLQRVCSKQLNGYQVHEEAKNIDSAEDRAVDSILMVLDLLFGGRETSPPVIDGDIGHLLCRCELFLRTDLEMKATVDQFHRDGWLKRFDVDGFVTMISNGVWPFESDEQIKTGFPK